MVEIHGSKLLKTFHSLNETADFEGYKNQAVNCTSLFEGVYTYDCPASSEAGYAECDAFKSSIKKTVGNVIAQDKCGNDGDDCDRKDTFEMHIFRNYHNNNIFKIRKGYFLESDIKMDNVPFSKIFSPDKNQNICRFTIYDV